ncbi:MAG: GNAT family N-acetyltransferase [Ktedonobacterales bacterium]
MSVYLLPVDGATDRARLAELLHAVCATDRALDDPAAPEESIRWRVVAVAECGAIAGYGATGRDPYMEPGRFWLVVVVDPAYRNQGVGAMLYDDTARFAWEMGATYLTTDIPGDRCEALAFARRRGFYGNATCAEHVRLQLNIAAGVPSSPREAVKARYREFRFEQAVIEART